MSPHPGFDLRGLGGDDIVTRPFSEAFKQKMVERLSGRDAVSARQLSRDLGIPQDTLSRWLREARSLAVMPPPDARTKVWSVDDKVRVLAAAAKLTGTELTALLEQEGVTLAELDQWRQALGEEGRASRETTRRIRKLERELARKDKALAEAAALLVLKKKVDQLWEDEDDDTDEGNEP